MANAKIDIVGEADLPLVADLYSQVFKPPHDVEFFKRRFLGRHNTLILIAAVEERRRGFFTGFELKPDVFFAWLVGILPDYRRQGIASQLMDGAAAWAHGQEYESIRFECHNQHRPMLHMAIQHGFDIVGLRQDSDRSANLVIFEKPL